jgi:V-type H+-transporting ATPase subunit C
LRETLNQLYAHLDSPGGGSVVDIEMPAGLGFSNSEYYPYVYYKLNIDMISSSTSLL